MLAEITLAVIVLRHTMNRAKGVALQTGFQHANGKIVAIQDADLEYYPIDLKRIIAPILDDEADVILGPRFATGNAQRFLFNS